MVVSVQHQLGAMLREHVQEFRRIGEPLVPWAPAERRMMEQHHAKAAGELWQQGGDAWVFPLYSRIDEHHSNDFRWIAICKEPHVKAAQGMAYHDVRRMYFGTMQKRVEVLDDRAGCPWKRPGIAKSESCAIIRTHAREFFHGVLYRVPGQRSGELDAKAGVQDDRWRARSGTIDVHPLPVANVHEPLRMRIRLLILRYHPMSVVRSAANKAKSSRHDAGTHCEVYLKHVHGR